MSTAIRSTLQLASSSVSRALVPCRSLNANRAAVAGVKRETFTRQYLTTLVLPDGSTVNVRYPTPRQIIRLPIDLESCTKEQLKKIKFLRRPRETARKVEEVTATFDPKKYLRKK